MEPTQSEKLFTKEERQKYDEQPQYFYVSTGSSASAFKPITVLRTKAKPNELLVAGRYSRFNEKGLLYLPLTEEEQRLVTQQIGPNKVVKFL